MSRAISESRIAWCAGVIDVLGNIKLRTMETGAKLPAVYVSSARQDILEVLADLTGMTVTQVFRNYNRLGCGEHCTEPHQHVLSTTGRWTMTGMKATVFLAAIVPYMEVQKIEAEQILAHGLVAPHKPATVQKMYDLGWPHLDNSQA